jgi:hypothetical protein
MIPQYPHWIGSWVGHKGSPDTTAKRKFSVLAKNQTPAMQPVDSYISDWAIPYHFICINLRKTESYLF